MWTLDNSFNELVKNCGLSTPSHVGKIGTVIHKLRMLKNSLKVWNREVFDNVFECLRQAQVSWDDIQIEIASMGFSNERHGREIVALTSLNEA